MAAGTFKWFRHGLLHVASGDINWATDTVKVLLATSAYTPDQDAHEFRSSVTDEVTGTGYTAGGATLASKSLDHATTKVVRLIAADVALTGSTITGARTAVVYKVVGSAATDILLGYATVNADTASLSGTMTLNFDNTNGILTLTAS